MTHSRLLRNSRGFTLTELAVVFTIVALLLASAMYTLSAQSEQRNFEDTRRRVEDARNLVLAFAMVNGRLPCPARSTSAGDEVRNAAGECKDAGGTEDYYGGAVGGAIGGLLPARAIGYQNVNAQGSAIDAYGNPIRYIVEKFVTGCAGSSTLPHFTSTINIKANGMTCQPRDLLLCKSATGISGTPGATSCGAAGNILTNQNIVVAAVYSVGKNFSSVGTGGADEAANTNTASANDPVFVFHTPVPAGAAGGEFDDYVVWVTVGELYGRLIAAGKLP
jgi:prepilin-type N-terminal cleavage/methylation domain-containing protein